MSDSDKAGAEHAFGVLGPLEASYAGVALPLGGGRQRAVLALLVCEVGHTVPVERLVDGLWGGSVPPGAVTSVQTYVFHLRQVLEPGRARGSPGSILVTVPGGYRLDVDRRCVDLVRFEDGVAAGDAAMRRHEPDRAVAAYGEALSLWRGDVLADLSDYEFVAPHRARLDELRASAQQSRVQAELDLGHHVAAVAELGVLLSENPLREGLHAQRILALYRSGRQSDALAAYRELRSVLDTELGIEPSPPLQELNTRVLRQDPLLNWTPPTSPPLAAQTLPTHPYLHEGELRDGHRRRLPALAVVTAAVAALAGGAGLPIVEAPTASAAVVANSVSELDASGRVVASIPVGTDPTALAVAGGAIWVVNAGDDTVSKINPSTHAVQQIIDVGRDPRALVATGDDLWVTNFTDNTLSRIHVPAGKRVDTVDVGSGPAAIAAGPAGIWVANSKDNTVQRIDPQSGTPGDPIDVGEGPDGLVVDDTSVWVANGRSGTVTHIDAGTGDQMTDPIRVGSGPRGILRVGDDVWVADELSLSVTRIDVRTRQPHTIDVGDGPTSIAALDGWLWVAERYSGSLTRINLKTEKREKVDIRAPARGVTVAGGRLWVASGAFASTNHRGGTLVVATDNFPAKDYQALDGIDPARVYDVWAHPPIRVVYDGLVAYHYSGLDAQVLVPDLATTVPEPTDGGRTYIFNLRRGIRYSTGAEVKASDFVRGVQRALLLSPRHDFYRAIVGGRTCKHGRTTSCDLSNGVVADDLAGRVTFHLVAPDPQFLYKLVQLVVPTPEGTPLARLTSPLPGTGPYRIASYKRNKKYSLDRNPFFQEWSAPAQPAAFLDAITWVKVDKEMEAVDAVRQGRADLAELPGSEVDADQLIHDLTVSSPNHVHDDLTSLTGFTILNSAIPPFDDIRARRAFNYAVDRNKIVQMTAGPSIIKPTCQLMPPTMPSYVRYCPYTTGAPGGEYQGPDLAKARELVRASGTKGMKVTVTDVVNDWNGSPELDEYLTDVLRSIGYDAYHRRLRNNPRNNDYFYDPESPIQVESGVFIADFPLPSNMYEIVACAGTAYPAPLNYCNRELDRRAAAANAKLVTEPGAALREWTQIDRELTDQAALVPITNLVDWWVTSERVGNYQNGGQDYGPLLSQLWVQ